MPVLLYGLEARPLTKSDLSAIDFVVGLNRFFMKLFRTRMWANAQPDGRPAEHRWRPLFNAPKFG